MDYPSLVPSPTSAKMAAARERWVWHISPHFLVLLTQHYQDSGWPIRLLKNIIQWNLYKTVTLGTWPTGCFTEVACLYSLYRNQLFLYIHDIVYVYVYVRDSSSSNSGVLLRVVDEFCPVTQRQRVLLHFSAISPLHVVGSLRKWLVKLLAKAPATRGLLTLEDIANIKAFGQQL